MECYWIRNSEYEIARLCKASKGVAVLPLASIESHGPHLPVGSDILCAEELLRRLVARETVAVLPILTYSYVAHARMLPGAIHIPTETLTATVEAICDEVYRNGFGKIVLLHCHGGNVTLDGEFLARMLERGKPYVVYSLPVFGSKSQEIAATIQTKDWGHACEMETSMNLVAAPELVNLERLGKKTFPSRPAADLGAARTAYDWTVRHPEMAVGEPQKATKAKGERIFAIWEDEIVAIIRKIKRDRMTLPTLRDYVRKCKSPKSRG